LIDTGYLFENCHSALITAAGAEVFTCGVVLFISTPIRFPSLPIVVYEFGIYDI